MSAVLATLRRELQAYFYSPLAYAVLALFLLVNGFVFALIVGFLNDPRSGIGAPMQLFFGQTLYFWLVLLFVAPVLTMRLLSEERRSGTIESLMTAPITAGQVVAGKYLAALAFYVFLWLPTTVYVALLARQISIDPGPVLSGYLGILGIGALFLAVGVFASGLSKNQIVAALATFALLVLLFSFGLLESLTNSATLKKAFGYLDLWSHMSDFAKGIVDTRRLVYYGSTTLFFLFAAAKTLEAKKWK